MEWTLHSSHATFTFNLKEKTYRIAPKNEEEEKCMKKWERIQKIIKKERKEKARHRKKNPAF